MWLCTKCGDQIKDGNDFCEKCGTSIKTTSINDTQTPYTQQPDNAQPYVFAQTPPQSYPPSAPQQQQHQPYAPQQTYAPQQQHPYAPQQPQPYAPPQPHAPPQYNAPQQTYTQSTSDSGGAKFVQNYLGFVVMGIFIIVTLGLIMLPGFLSPHFMTMPNLTNIIMHSLPMGIIALGTVVAARIKGPDLSMGSMMALSGVIIVIVSSGYGLAAGMLVALLACVLFGLINGTLISLLNAPSIVVTLITAALIQAIVLLSSGGSLMMFEGNVAVISSTPFVLAFGISVVIAIGAILITNRLPAFKRVETKGAKQKLMDILGYGLVAIIACIAGYVMLRRLNVAAPFVGSGFEISIITIFAAVQSSKLLKNSLVALAYGLAVTLMLSLVNNVIIFIGINAFWNTAYQAIMALILLCTACAAQGGWRSMLTSNLEECLKKD